MESPEIWAKLATQVGQNDDIVVLGKFNVSPNYLEVAKEFKATHYNNEFWDEFEGENRPFITYMEFDRDFEGDIS